MKAWIGTGVVGIALLGLVGLRWKNEVAAANELKQQQGARRGSTPPVEVATAGPREILATVETVGTLESPNRARLSPRTSGRVSYLEVREGDDVDAGQILVKVDPQELDAQVMQQRASLAESRARLAEAQTRFASTETEVESQVQQSTAALARAKADLELAERSLEAQIAAAQADVDSASAQVAVAQADLTNAQAELRAAQADYTNAQVKLNRAQELEKQGYVSKQAVEDAALQVESKRAGLDVKQGQKQSAEADVKAANARKLAAEKRFAIAKQSAQTDVKLAKAAVTQAEAALAQAKANRSRTPAFRQNLKALEAGVAAADAQLGQASARRSDTELRAPFKGTVTERLLDAGSLATPGQTVLIVESIDWLYVSASVPVEQAVDITPGKSADIRIDALPSQTFTGTVDRVNRAADAQSRQVEVKIRVDNRDGKLRPGMFAKVSLITGRTQAKTVVPIEAVKTKDGVSKVMVIGAEDKIEERTVKTGVSDRGGVEVVEGLQPGDRVVVLSYSPVKDGQKVKIAGAEDKPKGDGK